MVVICQLVSKRFVMAPDPGFLVFNNTLIWPCGNLFTTPQPVLGRAIRDFVNFRYFNNILSVDRMHKLAEWRGSLFEFYANLEVGNDAKNPHLGIIAGDGGLRADSQKQAGVNEKLQLARDSVARGKGILAFEEPDASVDLGAVPFGSEFRIVAGPGTAVDLKKLSPFARKIFYHPTLIRTAGPEPGAGASGPTPIWSPFSMAGRKPRRAAPAFNSGSPRRRPSPRFCGKADFPSGF